MTTRTRLADIVRLDLERVEVEPEREYRTAGVYGFGRGLINRGTIAGSDTSYRWLQRIREGQIVFSRLKAFEGAVAVVPPAFDGFYVSQEFPTFAIDESKALVSYFTHLCRWPDFWAALAGGSKGLGARRERLHADEFLALEISLPPIDQQHHIASFLDKACDQAMGARARVEAAGIVGFAIADGWVDSVVWDERPLMKLGAVAELNPPSLALAADEPAAFVPMAAVDEITGAITAPEERAAGELANYKQFQRGDVIFARITPCMQNGKSAVFDDARWSSGFGSTEFHVIRPTGSVSARWIHAVVRTRRFRKFAAERFTGTAGQQRVPAPFMREVSIPVPDDEAAVLREVDRIRGHDIALRSLRSRQQALAQALEPSLLNQAFARLA